MDTKGGKPQWGGDGAVLNWAIGIDMFTLMCVGLMIDGSLQCERTSGQTRKATSTELSLGCLYGNMLI